MKIFLFQVHLFRVNTKMSNTLINIMLIYLGVVAASAVAAAAGTRGAQFCSDEELRGGTELQQSAPPFTLEVRLQHTTASGFKPLKTVCWPGCVVKPNTAGHQRATQPHRTGSVCSLYLQLNPGCIVLSLLQKLKQ